MIKGDFSHRCFTYSILNFNIYYLIIVYIHIKNWYNINLVSIEVKFLNYEKYIYKEHLKKNLFVILFILF